MSDDISIIVLHANTRGGRVFPNYGPMVIGMETVVDVIVSLCRSVTWTTMAFSMTKN